MILNLKNISKVYNGNIILENINLTIEDRDRIGLIGRNGCGKTTLLKIIINSENPDTISPIDSEISKAPNLSIGYLAQHSGLDSSNTVIEEMKKVFAYLDKTLERMKEIETYMSHNQNIDEKLSLEYSKLSAYYEVNDGYNRNFKIKTILNGMGFPEDTYNRTISEFSGGEKTRLALAKLLLEEPNLLILDEPTNHLDFKTVTWLEDYLKEYKGALLIVSHDRYFLNKLCTSICEIERTHLTRYKGNYSAYTILKKQAVDTQWKQYEKQQKEIAKMEDYVAKNLVRASTSKSAKSRIKALDRMEIIEKPLGQEKNSKLKFEYGIEPPFDLLTVKNIDLSVGIGSNRKTLVDNLSFEIKRGEKVAIIGDNGIGKSTLLKAIQGKISHKGRVNWASNVKISYFEQESTNLNPANSIIEEIHSRYPTMNDVDIRSLLGKVRITGENVFKQIGVISGGERAKICFALMMLEKGNVLILDEPTNHLDVFVKEVLEDALVEYTGTIIFVSHDRYLLNKLSTRILEITSNGVEDFNCSFDDYIKIKQDRENVIKLSQEEQKRQAELEKSKQSKTNAYKSKEQRSLNAKKRQRIKEIEMEMENLQEEQSQLEEEITKEEVFSNYELMHKKCSRIDEIKTICDTLFDEWAELSED
ncbi:MAG: ABC-F family ATP-binding cassette domain-containing protein [Oscillospiraceae bacterium]